MILQDMYCKMYSTSKNKKIDDLILEMQLKISSHNDIVLEWIPYRQFDSIEEISKGDIAIVYSAIWKDGPLYFKYGEYIRKSDKKVALKCIDNSQNSIDEFLNEV